jgi:ComF family protein
MLGNLKERLLDAVYPPRCITCTAETEATHGLCPSCWSETPFISGPVCPKCGLPVQENGLTCEGCTRHPPDWSSGRAALLYEGAGRRVILSLKHGDRLDSTPALVGWMTVAGRDLIKRADVIVPIPLHWRRLARRSYNQAAELARGVAKRSHTPFAPRALRRRIATPPLKGLNRQERTALLENAIEVVQSDAIANRKVLLIDDVMTSGATLAAASRVLKQSGAAEVDVLVLARVAIGDTNTI